MLLIVDIIWVASSEVTKYLFNEQHYDKPYFSTYLKLSLFLLYLTGFGCRRTWWLQCKRHNRVGKTPAMCNVCYKPLPRQEQKAMYSSAQLQAQQEGRLHCAQLSSDIFPPRWVGHPC